MKKKINLETWTVDDDAETKKSPLKTVSVQLHPDEITKLQKISRVQERSVSNVIRRAVRDMLERSRK